MKIGVIGSGRIGGLVGTLWARAGHEVKFSSRHPEQLDKLVAEAGPPASRGSVDEAARFGDVVLISVPFKSLRALGQALAAVLRGKVVLETGNPYPERDGDIARQVLNSGRGTGPFVAEWFPGARIVRAFNTVWDKTLRAEAHKSPPPVGIPLASDDPAAMDVGAALVRDAGFDPVIVGGLDRTKEFDVGSPVYNTGMSGPSLRSALHLSRDSGQRGEPRPEGRA
jgi:predicted dinucleotide-binding enzyme